MAASASSSTHQETYKYWGNIPQDIKDMMLCHVCNLQAYEKEPSVVLPCAHVMCLECMKDRLDMTSTRDEIDCPKCGVKWGVPFGNILGFPKDVFSLVLNNKLLDKGLGIPRPNPKCALHPREDVDRYCKQCCMSACGMCYDQHHKEHRVESIESQGERMDLELNGFKSNLNRKISHIGDVIDSLEEDQTRMSTDIQWTRDKIQEETKKSIDQLTLQQDEILEEAQKRIDELKRKQDEIRKDAQENIDQSKLNQDTLRAGARESLEQLNLDQGKLKRQFEQTLKQLEEQKESLENDQLFIDTLYNMGNESDRLSRVPGMKDMIAKEKLFSGKKLELKTIRWKFDVDKTEGDMSGLLGKLQIAESLVESLEGGGESLFPGLHHIGTVPISCKPAWFARSVKLFNQQYIIHTCGQGDNDKICIHNTTGAVTQLIPVPGMKWCSGSVVVDAGAGEIVAADQVQGWTDEMKAGKSKTHLSGSLHWLTLNNHYDVIKHEVIPMQCVQGGYMNVNHAGHLLVITGCITREHPKQLVVYDNNICHLRTIALSDMFVRPYSAVSIGSDKFVVVDNGKNQVMWIDQHGQILQQYGQQPGEELNDSAHIIQHLKGSLLITDFRNHRVHLVGNDGKLLRYLLDDSNVRYPRTLHLDEQTGLLCVVQGMNVNNLEVKTFQFLPCTTHIKQISLSVQV